VSHNLGVETTIGPPERLSLLEDGEPGETGLVDLQYQPLEELGIALEREAVLPFVVGSRRGSSEIHVCSFAVFVFSCFRVFVIKQQGTPCER
jgi:hypothetical protein